MTNDEMINNLHATADYLISICYPDNDKRIIPFIEEFKTFELPKKFYILQPLCDSFGNEREAIICSGFFRFLFGTSNDASIRYAAQIDIEVRAYLEKMYKIIKLVTKP